MGDDKMNRTYRYRLYPTRKQIAALDGQLAFACDLWNAALEQRKTAYRTGTKLTTFDQINELTEFEAGLEMNRAAKEAVLRRLGHAFDAFFRRLRNGEKPGFPRFKPRVRFNTLAWRAGQGGASIVGDRVRIQGVGHIKVKWHRDLPGTVKQTRITRRNGRWYVAFSVEMERPAAPPATGRGVGVDLGVRVFASLSNGEALPGPRAGSVEAPAIRRAQRKVARRKPGSNRRRKAGAELARRHERAKNRREDAAHKASRQLVERFDLIAVEDLKPPQMVRSGRWLAREISDQGWSTFLRLLEEKAESAARQVIRVDPRNTSRTCPECGSVDKDSRKGPLFCCTACGHADDADVNAARNILAKARTEPSGANAEVCRDA